MKIDHILFIRGNLTPYLGISPRILVTNPELQCKRIKNWTSANKIFSLQSFLLIKKSTKLLGIE